VATNHRRDWARSREEVRPPEQLPQPTVPSSAEEAQRLEERRLLSAAIADLPPSEREVFLLRKREGLTYAEVADAVGCSPRTAKNRMAAALTLLGAGLERRGLLGGEP
jgi:RNA polymerase sigma-70 factor (ECF subfamily)